MNDIPRFDELFNPVLDALRVLGGSARNNEITQHVIKSVRIPDAAAERLNKRGTMTELEYRLTWSRSYLKQFGVIDNSTRGVWSLTEKGKSTAKVVPSEVVAWYRSANSGVKSQTEESVESNLDSDGRFEPDEIDWRLELSSVLATMHPATFERLCQRLLRESGFIEVEVTGRPGDGGIDGHGIIRLAGLVSFPVMFQCMRYSGNVSARDLRDFRGAMQGRSEKGLILTTGGFTPGARQEATRDGAPPIDLIDGESLLDLLKDLGLGLKVTERTVEDVEVVSDFFESI